MSRCRYCREGNKPKESDGRWQHWIVKSFIPARIDIRDCADPPRPAPEEPIND